MGLSASQARLLSLTARISDNELHSQTVANSKVRLADKSQEASKEYIRSLNASKLVYTTYDAKGQQTELALTPSLMYQFSSLKNQYGISNTAGQLLISQFDAMNFDTSNSIDEFIYKYGVSKVDNPKYIPALEAIYGENYAICYDSNSNPPGPTVGFGNLGVTNWLSSTPSMPSNQSEYNSWLNIATSSTLPPENTGVAGLYYNLLNHLNSPYAYPGDEPQPPVVIPYPAKDPYPAEPQMPDFAALATVYNDSACYDGVDATENGLWHMEHNLCHLIWGVEGVSYDATGWPTFGVKKGLGLDENGNRKDISTMLPATFSGIGYTNPMLIACDYLRINISANSNSGANGHRNSVFSGHNPGDETQTAQVEQAAFDLLSGLEAGSAYNCVQEIEEDILSLYCKLLWVLSESGNATYEPDFTNVALEAVYHPTYPEGTEGGSYPVTSDLLASAIPTAADLYAEWEGIYDRLANLTTEAQPEYEEIHQNWEATCAFIDYLYQNECDQIDQQNQENYNNYLAQHSQWENTWHKIENWQETGLELYQEYQYALANLPPQHIPDPEDPRTEWYTNLWHRLNGPSENKSADGTGGKYYKVLEDNLYENADWLQFALEHGVVALEQVVYVENADITTGLEHSKWQHTIYSSAVDIVTVEDEVAIQIAEAKYNKILKEIESKDKKYDMDIKKLDTEHNALQQEYEALKSVIQKNAERSFKAFS